MGESKKYSRDQARFIPYEFHRGGIIKILSFYSLINPRTGEKVKEEFNRSLKIGIYDKFEKIKNKYRISENGLLQEAFAQKIQNFVLPTIIGRINDYLKRIDDEFS